MAKVVAAKHLPSDPAAADFDLSPNSDDFRKIHFHRATLTPEVATL
jgi:hypothetical protein